MSDLEVSGHDRAALTVTARPLRCSHRDHGHVGNAEGLTMAVEIPEPLSRDTLGNGILDPREWQRFSTDRSTAVKAYAGDEDCSSVVVWCLNPGQENGTHAHPSSEHFIVVLEGEGVCLRGEGQAEEGLSAGQLLIVPRGVVHGFRNTGTTPMSYAAYSTVGYERVVAEGEPKR